MSINNEELQKLFMTESMNNVWKFYKDSLINNIETWDYIILTSSNEEQAKNFDMQINYRLKTNNLNKKTKYLIIPDPNGKRVGSGGATINALKKIQEDSDVPIENLKIMIIHSGGDSKRVPQYSSCGKLFSSVQRELPDGRASTLFDEFIIMFSSIPPRISSGALILSGDVLLSFNPMQIDFHYVDSAAISIKENVEKGSNHGVFVSDEEGIMKKFLHKQSKNKLMSIGAVNNLGNVDIDTGAIFFSSKILLDLLEMVNTNEKFNLFVNDKVRLNLYGDLLYPIATLSTYEDYLIENPEFVMSDELIECRKIIWKKLCNYTLKVTKTSPSKFIHFGTTKELIELVNFGPSKYKYLGWKRNILSNVEKKTNYSINSSYIDNSCKIGINSYIEHSKINNVIVGHNTILSNVVASNVMIPSNVCLSSLKLKNGMYVTRIYGIEDNPKDCLGENLNFLNTKFIDFINRYNIDIKKIWPSGSTDLWNANLYCMHRSSQASVESALKLYKIIYCDIEPEKVYEYFNCERTSLNNSFNSCNNNYMINYINDLEISLRSEKYLAYIKKGYSLEKTNSIILDSTSIDAQIKSILSAVQSESSFIKCRTYLYISKIDTKYNYLEQKCYDEIKESVEEIDYINIDNSKCLDKVLVELPIRVNFGGGWSDTPPYCFENGGSVLNMSCYLNAEMPIKVMIKKTKRKSVTIRSNDLNIEHEFTDIGMLKNCSNILDDFSLVKASLIISSVVRKDDQNIDDIINRIGCGIEIVTDATLIPKGSGLGTSSILAGACLKSIYKFLNYDITDEEICNKVLLQEQLMGTGGGWQDQIGGIIPGIKLTTTEPGVQEFNIKKVKINKKLEQQLNERLVLIYTGQRRLAKNLLRNVMNNYLLNKKKSLKTINRIKYLSVEMYEALNSSNINRFCNLLNEHWKYSKLLDSGSSNYCIEQILLSISDLIDGRMICGAGGGGFLQVILKENKSFNDLEERLNIIFQDSGIKAYKIKLFK